MSNIGDRMAQISGIMRITADRRHQFVCDGHKWVEISPAHPRWQGKKPADWSSQGNPEEVDKLVYH